MRNASKRLEIENKIEPERKIVKLSTRSLDMIKTQRQRDFERAFLKDPKQISQMHHISDDSANKENTLQSAKLIMRVDKSVKVLVSIVILFLVTHGYRLALKIYEVSSPRTNTMETFKICFALNRYVFTNIPEAELY